MQATIINVIIFEIMSVFALRTITNEIVKQKNSASVITNCRYTHFAEGLIIL